MSVLYVVGPFHKEINELFHSVAHTFEKPQYILSHQKNDSNLTTKKENTHANHQISTPHYLHKLVSFLSKVLEESQDTDDPRKTRLSTHKIDKHLSNNYTKEKEEDLLKVYEKRYRFIELNNRICKGYLQGLRKPPATHRYL